MPLEIGSLLYGRYRIERILGQGGMGAVYLATDETLGFPCAVKENLSASKDSERQFRREATLLASLRHHNLPRVTDHFILGNQQYLVMDFIAGQDLKERLARDGPLSEVDIQLWAAQLCEALNYLHNLNPPIIHRDIKPANLKLTEGDENIVLVDFGIAKASIAGSKTTTSAVAFTPGFAPPEQYGLGRSDQRTDEYALAATLYTLLTGQTPPDSMDRLLGHTKLIPPKELRPDLAQEVNDALVRALELKPDDRFENLVAFKEALFADLTAKTKPISALQATLKPAASAQATQPTPVGAQVTVAHPAGETIPAPPLAPKRAGLPGWAIPAALGGVVVIVIGALGFGLAGVIGFNALGATDTPVPSATQAIKPTVPAPTVTPILATKAPTLAPPTATPMPLPLPTDTPTLVPPTAIPTAAGTPIGGGSRIAFISNRDGQYFQIYTMNLDGNDVKQITSDPVNKWDSKWTFNGTQLAWSPDGTKLLYIAPGDPANGLDIFMINADGSNPIDLTSVDPGRPAGDDYQPTWCSNGTIAFTSLRTGGVPQLFTLTLDNPRPVNNSAQRNSPREYDVSFFSDCKRMIFVTTVNGIPELWRFFPDLNSYRVFRSDIPLNASAEDPAVSPDGKYVAYTRRAPTGTDIILAAVENRLLNTQLTNNLNNSSPDWSPDGAYIVFVSKRDGNPEIYRMLTGGQEQINLTNNSAVDTDPVWQPMPKP